MAAKPRKIKKNGKAKENNTSAPKPEKPPKPSKQTPEEELKHIPKSLIEQRFISGHTYPQQRTLGQKAADWTTKWVGSWTFILALFVFMATWMSMNVYFLSTGRWDPYPFILLNFVLSCLAAIQAPIILMSQNRQSQMDRLKAERDFAVNRKSEKEVENMQQDLDEIKRLITQLANGKPKNSKPE